MKLIHLTALSLLLVFAGCGKSDYVPMSKDNNGLNLKNGGYDTKVAEKDGGLITCTIDEDILEEALSNYFNGAFVKKHHMKEFRKNKPDHFYAIKGRMKLGNTITRYAFEVIEVPNSTGGFDLMLPVAGTLQAVVHPKGCPSKLKLTSGSTGYMWPPSPAATYYSTTSVSGACTNGTNGLILEVIAATP